MKVISIYDEIPESAIDIMNAMHDYFMKCKEFGFTLALNDIENAYVRHGITQWERVILENLAEDLFH